ncbi:hypothetical protein DIQ79_23995 [Mycolicibacterium smegmatis]|uniref:Uncharacterized protein n=1 Tax=Mycolicibacterium smegmatis (strain ATCC 700084 / mc(2)155) TaxID=246196 RepID=A0R0L9_MYCS2|nr:hypothetical protein MSMEG_4432 [Mycolicibacterium smegmatis MC2 155]TBM40385.1 hypothetical protein DIQ86_25905 [Mycolicibacterium smegmatis]TBH33099.1 hypothetical protein EYS45_22705 [Mycolicibacterium smegmatis MC2 155]TBM48437.1 hypothetical protein DIQ85_24005 [Mycolicibacterium smegmatis]TBM58120.1 hypothetical protein DIQ83_23410 [Mycolicibacterium smegmatis]
MDVRHGVASRAAVFRRLSLPPHGVNRHHPRGETTRVTRAVFGTVIKRPRLAH